MRLGRIPKVVATGVLVLGGLGVAYAQEPAAAPPAPAAAVDMKREVKLTSDEQMKQAESVISRIESVANTIRKQLEQARAQRDVVKSLCLNDKLTQVDVASRSARERRDALKQAASRQDTELANHEYTILMVLKDRVEQLMAEANQCIGEEAGFVGETRVTFTVDPNMPKDDPSQYPEDGPTITLPPNCASCVR